MSNSLIKKKQSQNRRGFLESFIRGGMLGVLGLAGTALMAKRKRPVRENKCINRAQGLGGCRDCGLLDNCRLPQGTSARAVLKKG